MYQYKPLDKLSGLCKYCVGNCCRLEDFDFNGVNRCTLFEPSPNYPNDWRKKYEYDLKKGIRL